MVKEIGNALISTDVNVKLVATLQKSIRRNVNFKELPAGANKKKVIQKAVFDELCQVVEEAIALYHKTANCFRRRHPVGTLPTRCKTSHSNGNELRSI